VAICPKVEEVTLVVGPANVTLFNALKASARNVRTYPSDRCVFFSTIACGRSIDVGQVTGSVAEGVTWSFLEGSGIEIFTVEFQMRPARKLIRNSCDIGAEAAPAIRIGVVG
jgi:hypothetical protein